jgi:glutaminase
LFHTQSLFATPPTDEQIQKVMMEAYTKYKNETSGKNADYIKALAEVDSNLFGISVVTVDGKRFHVGDSDALFSIQSISKVFTFSKTIQDHGAKAMQEKIGVNATGLAFNSIMAIEQHGGSASNPFVNAGAIQSVSWVTAKDTADRWAKIKANMDAFAGRTLPFNEKVYDSEVNDNKRNQAISKLLDAYGKMGSDPLEATTEYTKQCSVNVSANDLAVMGATLANHGLNPISKVQVVDPKNPPYVMAVMETAGLYDNAGDWLYETGTPAKSGVGGGILAVIPGKLAVGTFSPKLDPYGNSVRGQLAAKYIIEKLGLNPLAE